ncbi:uncharacterized protein C05D11.13 [Aethina tumida]|uniref:uncharacterized protein C05D11.13 n=1 Tax=Aethina tumida TaxID=116153 RepID=UPI00214986FF|nr:uncharacterized protein C05D11.13 [Aethina tumida]
MYVCCVFTCENTSETNQTHDFHQFPLNFHQCLRWIRNVERPDFVEQFSYAGAQPFIGRYVCSRHFCDNDYVDSSRPHLGLKPDAVPVVFTDTKIEVKIDPDFLNESILEYSENYPSKFIKHETNNNDGKSVEYPMPTNNVNVYDYMTKRTNCHVIPPSNELLQSNENQLKFMDEHRLPESQQKTEQGRKKNALRASYRRTQETTEQTVERRRKDNARAAQRRKGESHEETKIRRMKNMVRASFRRMNETSQQRAERLKKDSVRAAQRRERETEEQTKIRRYNDAVRAAFRRSNETEEQKQQRREKDTVRAAKRRSVESPEQREVRLFKDRERAMRRRMLMKITGNVDQPQYIPP